MPTVSNHDVLGPMTWGSGGNSRPRYFPQDSLDRSDARGGINSLLFEESSTPGACAGNAATAPEHAYATNAPCPRNSLVSTNGYYGFHQQHGVQHGVGQDCPMDTSENENNPPAPRPAFGFGGSPSAGALGFGGDGTPQAPQGTFPLGPAHAWNADPFRNHGPSATRKRSLEARGLARGVGGWCDAGLADAEDMASCSVKRTKPSPNDAAEAVTGKYNRWTRVSGSNSSVWRRRVDFVICWVCAFARCPT